MFLLYLFVCIVFGIFLWIFLTARDRRMVSLYKQFPCDAPEWPIIGHVYQFLGNSEHVMRFIQNQGKEATRKGGMLGMWQLNELQLVVSDAVICEHILKNCLEKGDIARLFRSVTGNAGIFAPVSIWRARRKLHTPIFANKKLQSFVEIFSKQSLVMVEKLKHVADKGPIAMWPHLNSYALDAVCEATMGIKVNAQHDINNPFLVAVDQLLRLSVDRISKPWFHNDFVAEIGYFKYRKYRTYVYNFIDKLIQTRKEIEHKQDSNDSKKNLNFGKSFLDMMIHESAVEHGFTDIALREETFILLTAATDTSAVGTGFTLVLLSRYPHVQEKVYQELQEVFGDSDRAVVAEDLPHLKYLEAVVKESLRLYPPAPLTVRKLDRDMTLPSGVTLVKGCGVFINIWAVHHNALYWGPDADEFRPERFLDGTPIHAAAYLPFSYGPRNCIGFQFAYMSMKTTIANILRSFRILPALDPATGEIPPLKLKFEYMMRDVDNYMVCLEKRFI